MVGNCVLRWGKIFGKVVRGAQFCLKGRTAFEGGGESRRLPRSAVPNAERRAGVRTAAFVGVGDIAGIGKAAAVADEGTRQADLRSKAAARSPQETTAWWETAFWGRKRFLGK